MIIEYISSDIFVYFIFRIAPNVGHPSYEITWEALLGNEKWQVVFVLSASSRYREKKAALYTLYSPIP